MSPFFPLTLLLYAAACALYLAQSVGGGEGDGASRTFGRVARYALAGAFLLHAADIGVHCAHGMHPASSAREAVFFVAWVTVGIYLATTIRYALPLAGALIVPVTLVLTLVSQIGPAEAPGRTVSALAALHIGLATAGIAAFAVAAGDAVVYLLAEGQLKGRRTSTRASLRVFGRGLPSLETLDRLNRGCIQLGFPLFTLAIVVGGVWLLRLPGDDSGLGRLMRPQYLMAVFAWLLFGGLLVARFVAGVRGRRAALVTLGGFAASRGVLVIYLGRDLVFGVRGGA